MLTIWGKSHRFCDGIRRREFLKIGAQGGVGPSDAVDRARPHVSGRHHKRTLTHGGDGFIGRDLVLVQFIGIERNDDGPLVPPNGGGAETPGSVANRGRTRFSA